MKENGSISFYHSDILLEDLSSTSKEFLEFFAEEKRLCSSQITEILKSFNKPMAYKNVNEHVHQLANLNLIKKVEVQLNKRIKYYELTNEGIFHILKNGPTPHLIFMGNKFIQNYKENDFFKNLVYPLLSSKTIDLICTRTEIDFRTIDPNEGLLKSIEIDTRKINVDSIHVLLFFTGLFEYLRNCCRKIQEVLKEIAYKKSTLKPLPSYYYSEQTKIFGKDFMDLIVFLESEKIIDNIQPKDIKIRNLGTIIIKKENIEVIISKGMKKLVINRINKNNNEFKKFRYNIDEVNFSYKKLQSFFMYEEKRLNEIANEISPFLKAFVMNLIFMFSEDGKSIPDNEFNKSYKKNEGEFIKALINDEKFVEYAKSLVNDLSQSFTKMMSIKKQYI